MNPFRSFDIRGVYPAEINEEIAYNAGRAAVIFLKAKQIIVGRDCRTSSLALKKSLVYGVTDQGCDVIDIGYCNTPMAYFAAQKYNALMITASHNPKEYNGIKITRKGVEQIGETNGLKQIEKLTNSCHFPEPNKKGTITSKNILNDYVRHVRKLVGGRYKKLRVLIDCGNGMAGYVVPTLLKGLPFKYKLMYAEMDGTYPNHTPNPAIPENTQDIQKEMKKGKYDIGIAYDGDCDRVFFIDEKGQRINADHTLALFVDKQMKKGQYVSYAANCSRIVKEVAEARGGKAHPCKIGHTEVPLSMKKNKGILGGEISGHFYFKNFHYADSGDIAALTMLDILSRSGKRMSELIAPYRKYPRTEELNFSVKDRQNVMDLFQRKYHLHIVDRTDGLGIDLGGYWFNIRISKTENVVRLNMEARTAKDLKKGLSEITKLIK